MANHPSATEKTMPLTREEIQHMRHTLVSQHELYPLTPTNIHALCDMAQALAEARRDERERCAKACDEHRASWIAYLESAGPRAGTATLAAYENSAKTAAECAKHIRALGNEREGKS
jgi:hypothetical protein